MHNKFNGLVADYFKGNLFSVFEKSLFFPETGEAICFYHAGRIKRAYELWIEIILNSGKNNGILKKKKIEPYTRNHTAVLSLRKYLEENLKPFLLGAYIHGSLASGEEINYSDFDAFLIFGDKGFINKKTLSTVCFKTLEAQKILYQYDALQHHGFFVLTENDLRYFCQDKFPLVLFDEAKSLFEDKGLIISLNIQPSSGEEIKVFQRMARTVKEKIGQGRYPRNYYQLKLLLSQIMLLPALYLQAKGMYVSKKDSFSRAKRDFSSQDWEIMEKISLIREKWDFTPSRTFVFLQKRIKNPFFSTAYQKKIGEKISKQIRSYLTHEFYSSVLRLIDAMELKLMGLLSTRA